MSDSAGPSPLSPDDNLPPVQPPSAGFILQLFIIPGVIVTIIVLVWLMFNWLAQMGNNPQSYIEALEKNSHARWQAAISLSTALRDERHDKLKEDPATMHRLAAILDREVDDAHNDDESVRLRIYLCQALGYFRIAEGLPSMLRAATLNRDEKELPVRLSAVQGIGNLLNNIRQSQGAMPGGKELPELLGMLSRDPESEMRSRVANVLGVIGDDASKARLRKLLRDESTNVVYNAAVGLARNGDAEVIPTLVEMLDPALKDSPQVAHQEAVEQQNQPQARENTLASIQGLALDGIQKLVAANPQADRGKLIAALDKLIASNPRQDVLTEARATLELLHKSAAK